MKRSCLFLFLAVCLVWVFAQDNKQHTKVSILGDSYSTFAGYLTPDTNLVWYYPVQSIRHNPANDVSRVEDTWWYKVIEMIDGKLEINNSYSGATICNTGYRHVKRDFTDRSFITRSNQLGDPDLIFICGGTNDDWADAPIGEYVYGNWTKEELFSFRPALAKLLYDIKGNYPTAQIVFMLNSELKEDINDSVHIICKHYGVTCVDLHDIDKQKSHPSIKGMTAIATQVFNSLKALHSK